jgi:hypothetical protein
MRKVVFGMLLLTAFNLNESSAQLLRHYGVKVALTSATQRYQLTLDPGLGTKRRVGFNVGAFAEWLDIPPFSLVSQVEYAQRGMGQDFVLTGPSGPTPIGVRTLYSRLDYLSIPIVAKLRFPMGLIAPYILAGPRVDILLGYRSDENAFNAVYDKFKKTSVGGSAGVGIELESVLPFTVLAEVRYNFDFADSYETDFLKVRNNSFDVWLGVAL